MIMIMMIHFVVYNHLGNIKYDSKIYNHVDDFVKAAFVVHMYISRDENVHVNGVTQIFDFTKFTVRHQRDWGIEQNKKLMKCWHVSLNVFI